MLKQQLKVPHDQLWGTGLWLLEKLRWEDPKFKANLNQGVSLSPANRLSETVYRNKKTKEGR